MARLIDAEHVTPVLGLIRRRKLCIDPQYAGELRRLREDPNVSKSYFSSRGMRIDELGEALWSEGYVYERPAPNEVLHLVHQLFTPSSKRLRPVPSITGRVLQILSDGSEHSTRDLRRMMGLDPEVDLGRAIRRLRGEPWNLIVWRRRRRGRSVYCLSMDRKATAAKRVFDDAYPPPQDFD